MPSPGPRNPRNTMEGEEEGSSDFGSILRRYRLARGLSQGALAERAGLSLYGISALERGYRRTPQRGTLVLLAGALALNEEQRQVFENAAARPSPPRHRGSASVTVGPWPSARTATLPLALTSFVGREPELDQILALLGKHRLVTITGAGGVGKTQTALQAAIAQSESPDGACFVALAAIRDPSLVVAAIAAALRVQEVENHSLLDTLLSYFKDKTTLLILDNCEHVVQDAAVIANAVLLGCAHVRILATSREPLGAAGERTYRLPSLIIGDAVTLFVDRAQAVDVNFALNDEDEATVAEICWHLDGLPLAIELAAARVTMFPVKNLAKKLNDRFLILTGGARTALPRQQTMRATIEWSYELLSAPEQRLFERLSTFAGGCTLATATTVCATDDVPESDVLHLVSSLVDKSLVMADLSASEPRYGQLESFREYARGKLEARGEAAIIEHRHALALLEIAETMAAAHEFDHRLSWEQRVREERENWLVALRWALTKRGDVLLGQRLIGVLINSHIFEFGEAQRWLDAALELVDQETPRSVLAAVSLAQARIAQNTVNYKLELISSEKALVEFRALGDWLGVTKAQTRKGHALWFLGHRAEAQGLLEETLKFARESGLRAGYSMASLLRLLANVSEADVVAARRYVGEALLILHALGEEANTAYALADLATCEFLADNVEVALMHATDALAIALRVEHTFARCYALSEIATYLIALNRWDDAAKHACESLRLARENDWDVMAVWSILHLAVIAALQQRSDAERIAALYPRSGRLLGFVNARLAALGAAPEPIHRQEYERVTAVLHEVLGTEAVATLMAAGAAITEEQASEEAFAIIAQIAR